MKTTNLYLTTILAIIVALYSVIINEHLLIGLILVVIGCITFFIGWWISDDYNEW